MEPLPLSEGNISPISDFACRGADSMILLPTIKEYPSFGAQTT